ncbi:MAG: Uma2 family endonuclease [Acidobacteriota bacterium]
MSAVLERTISRTQNYGVKPRLITVAEYDRMIETGIYTENDRIELLNGEIIEIMPKGPKHSVLNDVVLDLFKEKLGGKIYARSQNPIILDNFSEPEPDIVLVKPPSKKYLQSHPTPADILLVMEISDTTLIYDREAKAAAYSRNGIRQYLLLNLQNETIEDFREPGADGYGFKRTLRKGDVFNLVAFPEIEINIDDLM